MVGLSTLCQQCGLCCDGSLFTFLPLEAAEIEATRTLGVRLEVRRDGRTAMRLPCPVLKGTCCGAYAQRPTRCRTFVCALGTSLVRKDTSMPAALAVVAEAKRRLGALDAMLPSRAPGDGRSVLQRAQQLEATEPDDARFRAVRAEARAIEALLRQHFIG